MVSKLRAQLHIHGHTLEFATGNASRCTAEEVERQAAQCNHCHQLIQTGVPSFPNGLIAFRKTVT